MVDLTRNLCQTGLGYANIGWHNSETIAYLKAHPDLPVVATGDIGIYFWTGRLPQSIQGLGGSAGVSIYVCQNDAVLVIMRQMPTEIYHLDEAEVVSGLMVVQEFNDGVIYRCNR